MVLGMRGATTAAELPLVPVFIEVSELWGVTKRTASFLPAVLSGVVGVRVPVAGLAVTGLGRVTGLLPLVPLVLDLLPFVLPLLGLLPLVETSTSLSRAAGNAARPEPFPFVLVASFVGRA